ncbi:MAG TPA: inositol monophosphatase family protein [Nitrososphaerales archaeon]|nr:inositol monophosphatase family protein [Nitrososphaerales archaeon]
MTNWKRRLLETAALVQGVSDESANSESRSTYVGRGKGGDRTLAVDRDAESLIVRELSNAGDLRFVSEERGEFGDKSAELTVIVDPIDGSSNFQRGIPFYCTSIAVADGPRLEDMKYAVVRNLNSGNAYFAERGGGATKDGRRMRTSSVFSLGDAVVGVDLSRASVELDIKLADLISHVKRQVHFGANALELCFVAEGLTDSLVDVRGKMRITDFAAGYLIAKEAGAILTSPDGSPLAPAFNLSERFDFVASANGRIHARILGAIRGGRRRGPSGS